MKTLKAAVSNFDPDCLSQPAVALRVDIQENESELPVHRHRKGQLVLALRGGVTCEVPDGLWMVPTQCGVWIPGGMPHSNRVTANGRICFLFVEPAVAALPDECCTFSITPLVREMIQHLAGLPQAYDVDGPTGRLVAVLLDELARMQPERLYLPISGNPRLRRIARALIADPADRSTVAEWGHRVALSERTLARLVLNETGMTFGRWRQQLHIIIALHHLSAGVSVQRVSEDLGYESVGSFITMFKKALGKPPARYFADKGDRS
ncbi:MAG TPA: helix-turn-helix transcriptional regulator [Herbaspirillum sp.]|jgi:AraC-like DNA-binding protein